MVITHGGFDHSPHAIYCMLFGSMLLQLLASQSLNCAVGPQDVVQFLHTLTSLRHRSII